MLHSPSCTRSFFIRTLKLKEEAFECSQFFSVLSLKINMFLFSKCKDAWCVSLRNSNCTSLFFVDLKNHVNGQDNLEFCGNSSPKFGDKNNVIFFNHSQALICSQHVLNFFATMKAYECSYILFIWSMYCATMT